MKKTRFLSLALTGTLCVSLLAGCVTDPYTGQQQMTKPGTGALIGSGAGALLGAGLAWAIA